MMSTTRICISVVVAPQIPLPIEQFEKLLRIGSAGRLQGIPRMGGKNPLM